MICFENADFHSSAVFDFCYIIAESIGSGYFYRMVISFKKPACRFGTGVFPPVLWRKPVEYRNHHFTNILFVTFQPLYNIASRKQRKKIQIILGPDWKPGADPSDKIETAMYNVLSGMI
jgi:hypothetical protein